jgi:HPt (histidine-containing phosphotransfer) domain-containing protein/CheY-like chemotaxis protein
MQDTGPRVLKPPSRASLLAALHRALGAESEASGGAPSSGETVPASARAGVRVLIVDDSPVTALVTSRIVESAGGEPLVASGPEPVERALAAQSIAVVVLDASRPEHRDLEAWLREGHPGLTLVSTPVGEAQLRAVLARAGRPTPFPREIEGGFDRRRLARNLGDDERAADQVLAAFVAQAGPLLDTLRSARASGDLPSVARGAHRLKGSLLWIGAERGAAAVSSLESRASDGDRDGTRMALDAVESEVGAVVAEIRKTTIS